MGNKLNMNKPLAKKENEMRRKDREKDMDFALNVVDTCPYGVVSMVTEDGKGYGVPLSIVRIGEYVYFHCARQGEKTENMKKNPLVSIACVNYVEPAKDGFTTYFDSAIVHGKAEEVTDKDEKWDMLIKLCERYTPENMSKFDEYVTPSLPQTAVWRVHIDSISGKSKPKMMK